MREVIARFCREYEYPVEAQRELLAVYEAIENAAAVRGIFLGTQEGYAQDPQLDYPEILEKLGAACKQENIPVETASLLLFICLVPQLYRYYEQQGLPAGLCRDSLTDLKWKLYECRKVHGVWGALFPPGLPAFSG